MPFTERQNPDGSVTFIGDDGFEVPRDIDEFEARYPNYVYGWAKRWLKKNFIDDDVLDLASDIRMHLRFLPADSSARAPGHNGRPGGCTDRIQCFNPESMHGANMRRFLSYVNNLMGNFCGTKQDRDNRNPVGRGWWDNTKLSLDAPIVDSTNNKVTFSDLLADPKASPEEALISKDRLAKLRAKLEPLEARIVELYFGIDCEPMLVKDIGIQLYTEGFTSDLTRKSYGLRGKRQ